MARDLDQVQEYEAKQQALVEGIASEMHRRTENLKDYREFFGRLAVYLLQGLTDKRHTSTDKLIRELGYELAWKRVDDFVRKEYDANHKKHELYMTERRYLMLKVFEKVFASVSSGIVSEYQREELAKEHD